MKNKLILVAILIAGVAFSSQTKAQGNFALGVKAGYNSSKFRTDNAGEIIEGQNTYSYQDAKDEAIGGLMWGAFVRIKIADKLSFQPELLYVKKGGETNFAGDFNNMYKSEYRTWDIPLLAHLRLIDLKVFNIYGVGGPVASFVANQDNKWSDVNSYGAISKNMETAQWSFQTGGGVEFGSFNVDVRYSWGLNEANKKLEQVNNNLTFSVGYKLFDL